MAFKHLENIILLFLQILMSLLNLLTHGVISDGRTVRYKRKWKTEFPFNRIDQRIDVNRGYGSYTSETIGSDASYSDFATPKAWVPRNDGKKIHKSNELDHDKNKTVYNCHRTKEIREASQFKCFNSDIVNKGVKVEERDITDDLTNISPGLSNFKSHAFSRGSSSNLNTSTSQPSPQKMQTDSNEHSNDKSSFLRYKNRSNSIISKISDALDKTKNGSTSSNLWFSSNNEEKKPKNEHTIKTRYNDYGNKFTEGEINDGVKLHGTVNNFPSQSTSPGSDNNIFFLDRQNLTEEFKSNQTSNSLSEINTETETENSNAHNPVSSKLTFADQDRKEKNSFYELNDTSNYTSETVCTRPTVNVNGANEVDDNEEPTVEQDEPEIIKDINRDTIYTQRRKARRRKARDSIEKQDDDSGIDEPCVPNQTALPFEADNVLTGNAIAERSENDYAGKVPRTETWDSLPGHEISQTAFQRNDNLLTATSTLRETPVPKNGDRSDVNSNAIEFLLSLQGKGSRHEDAEDADQWHQTGRTNYLEDEAIIAMSVGASGNNNGQKYTWADDGKIFQQYDTGNNITKADGLSTTAWYDDGSLAMESNTYWCGEDGQNADIANTFDEAIYARNRDKESGFANVDHTVNHGQSRTESAERTNENKNQKKRIKHRWRKYGNPNENPALVRDRIYAKRRREKLNQRRGQAPRTSQVD